MSQEMVDRYEELRHGVLTKRRMSQNLGLALFIHRGMKAWMEAWVKCRAVRKVPEKEASQSNAYIPVDVRGSIVMLLVSMTLNGRRKEEQA